MKLSRLYALIVLICCIHFALGQNRAIDSLANLLKTEQRDTNKVNNLNTLSGKLRGIAKYDTALSCAEEAVRLAEKLDFKKGISAAYRNIGITFDYQGNYIKAIEYHTKALTINEEIGNKDGIARNYRNIGNVYDDQANYPKAIEYDLKSLAIDQELGNKVGIAADLGNLGIVYSDQGDNKKALECDFQSLALDQQEGNKSGIAADFGNIAIAYAALGDYDKTLEYDFKALAINKEIGRKIGIAFNMNSIASIYTKEKKYTEAQSILDSSLELSKNIGEKNLIMNVYLKRAKLDSAKNIYSMAFEDYKNYIQFRDSLVNEANTKAVMNYEFSQKEAAKKAEQDKKDALAAAENHKQKIITWSVAGGLLMVMIFAGFVFRSLRLTTIQKQEIELKSKVIEEKNKDILDSILYAKRLQDAILPPLSLIKQYLPESFVLYKPKDIVAGDFYWMERKGEAIFIAAADCTGHGVPGALVSVVCSTALNRAVKEFQITEPGKILDKVRDLVLETFEKSESSVQDGMDISLASIDLKTKEIQWSGANNPLWLIKENALSEIKADKQPIGKYDKTSSFTTHTVKLEKGDMFYLFTDGYADQFGGSKGKKFKYKQLQDLLLANANKPMPDQEKKLETILNEWKEGLEQVDDILVIGIRV